MSQSSLLIGDVARLSGVKVPTIRYYEDIGLLRAPRRSDGNRRQYNRTDLRTLVFIRHARELGFAVDAIRALLSLQDHPETSCAAADAIARARLDEVERRIARLTALKSELERMIAECAQGKVADCRIIETLADSAHDHGRFA